MAKYADRGGGWVSKRKKEKCQHENGWVTTENFAIDNDVEVLCKCNNIGCNETRTFRFDVTNVTDISGKKKLKEVI
jgi:hypothetical protein